MHHYNFRPTALLRWKEWGLRRDVARLTRVPGERVFPFRVIPPVEDFHTTPFGLPPEALSSNGSIADGKCLRQHPGSIDGRRSCRWLAPRDGD